MYPESYTLVERDVLHSDSIDVTACTNDATYITCPHPSTLTDSDLGSETSVSRDYYVWEDGPDVKVLFTFSSEINLTSITLYYFLGRYDYDDYGLPELTFYTVPDDYELRSDLTNGNIIFGVSRTRAKFSDRRRITSSFNISQPVTMKKIVLEIDSRFPRFALSEIEFFTNREF